MPTCRFEIKGLMEIMVTTEEELESEDIGNFIKHDIKSKGVVITLASAAKAAAEGGRLHSIFRRVTGCRLGASGQISVVIA